MTLSYSSLQCSGVFAHACINRAASTYGRESASWFFPAPVPGPVAMPARSLSLPTVIGASYLTMGLRFAAHFCFMPYVSLWSERAGFSSNESTAFITVYMLGKFTASMIFGRIADAYLSHTVVYSVVTSASAAAVVGIACASSTRSPELHVFLFLLAGLTDTLPLLDAIIMRSLSYVDRAGHAARARGFGSLMIAAGAPVWGYVAQQHGVRVLFVCYAAFKLATVPVIALLLPVREAYAAQHAPVDAGKTGMEAQGAGLPSGSQQPVQQPRRSRGANCLSSCLSSSLCSSCFSCLPSTANGVSKHQLCALLPASAYCALGLLAGCGYYLAISNRYALIYLETVFNATGVEMGVSIASQTISECPVFVVAPWLLRKVGVHVALLSCMVAASLRNGVYAGLPAMHLARSKSLHLVYVFELAHGWLIAMHYTAIVTMGEELGKDGRQASIIGLASSFVFGATLLTQLLWPLVVHKIGLNASYCASEVVFLALSAPLLAFGAAALQRCLLSSCGRCKRHLMKAPEHLPEEARGLLADRDDPAFVEDERRRQ